MKNDNMKNDNMTDKSQQAINATEGMHQLQSVSGKFRETDSVEGEDEIREIKTWKPRYWVLYFPIDYLVFRIISWFSQKICEEFRLYDYSYETLSNIDKNFGGNREKFISVMSGMKSYRIAFMTIQPNAMYWLMSFFLSDFDKISLGFTPKYQVLIVRNILTKYLRHRKIISEYNVRWKGKLV